VRVLEAGKKENGDQGRREDKEDQNEPQNDAFQRFLFSRLRHWIV